MKVGARLLVLLAISGGCGGDDVRCTGGATVQEGVCKCPALLQRVDGECVGSGPEGGIEGSDSRGAGEGDGGYRSDASDPPQDADHFESQTGPRDAGNPAFDSSAASDGSPALDAGDAPFDGGSPEQSPTSQAEAGGGIEGGGEHPGRRLSASADEACLVRKDGAVHCWEESSGQLLGAPIVVQGVANAVEVAVSYGHSCAR